ncbi:hypothetical protein NBRC116188_23060 [Oceaniserpentilla sp. 4NH20-0058]
MGPSKSIPKYWINTNTGQCHRYNEYDIKPMNTMALWLRMVLTTPMLLLPLIINSTAPRHGQKALNPGNTLLFVITKAGIRIRNRPVSEIMWFVRCSNFGSFE